MLFEHVKERYDRTIEWLKMVNSGEITLSLPLQAPPTNPNDIRQPFRAGSREKFNHE
jgi:phage gp36-like protein